MEDEKVDGRGEGEEGKKKRKQTKEEGTTGGDEKTKLACGRQTSPV